MSEESQALPDVPLALELLRHPDPDPDTLPPLPPTVQLAEQAATHLVRAILRGEASVERLKAAKAKDVQAWDHLIAAAEAKTQSWRLLVRDWLLRAGLDRLTTPWFVASLTKPRQRVVIDDEAQAIFLLTNMGADKALEVKTRIRKSEFDSVYQAMPKFFAGCAHEETGEPGLSIRGGAA